MCPVWHTVEVSASLSAGVVPVVTVLPVAAQPLPVHVPVDDAERNLLDQEAPGISDLVATKRAMGMIMRNQEKRIADLLFNSTNFTVHNVTTEWDTPATATPIDDINDGIAAFRTQCGMKPDALIIGYTCFRDLKVCDQIVDQTCQIYYATSCQLNYEVVWTN